MMFKQSGLNAANGTLTVETNEQQQARTNKYMMVAMMLCMGLLFSILPAEAAVTGTDFKAVYDFVFDAATGYLGRAICIFAGIIGLGIAASTGKVIPAIIGVILAIFGTLGPTIINSLFNSAIIL